MRFNQIKTTPKQEQDLLEINMSPGNLESLTKNIDALIGIEYEMFIPYDNSQDVDLEPDWDYDTSTDSIDNILDFFEDANSGYNMRRLRQNLTSDYESWKDDQLAGKWRDDNYRYSFIREAIINSDLNYDLRNEANKHISSSKPDLDPESREFYDLAQKTYTEMLDNMATEEASDRSTSSLYYDEFAEAEMETDDYSESEWLSDSRRHTMMEIFNEYDHWLEWPHMTTAGDSDDSISEEALKEISQSLANVLNQTVKYSTSYHNIPRSPTYYILEPDSSLDSDESTVGLELISPPLSLQKTFKDMDVILSWAKREGAYTDSDTGLHINVSVPGYDITKLDYVKLAVLLGDQYILKTFHRVGNHYCESTFDKFKSRIAQKPEEAKTFLEELRRGLNLLASKSITGANYSPKYSSIHLHSDRVEFRGPGNNYLGADLVKQIKPTIMRFIVALDAAMKPELYQQEYYKKLYKLFASTTGTNDLLELFVRYSAGILPVSALKSFLRHAQLQRSRENRDKASSQLWWWRVTSAISGMSADVIARSPSEAVDSVIKQNPQLADEKSDMDAIKIRLATGTDTQNNQLETYRVEINGDNVTTVQGHDHAEAERNAYQWIMQQPDILARYSNLTPRAQVQLIPVTP